MNKISLPNVSLDCYMQQATEFNYHECHKGIIRKYKDGNMRFEESCPVIHTWERNPHLFEGEYINMARRKNGTLMFNFKNVKTNDPNFDSSKYAIDVYRELVNALQNIK